MCCKFSNLAFSSVSRKMLDQVTTFEMQGEGKKTLPSPILQTRLFVAGASKQCQRNHTMQQKKLTNFMAG